MRQLFQRSSDADFRHQYRPKNNLLQKFRFPPRAGRARQRVVDEKLKGILAMNLKSP